MDKQINRHGITSSIKGLKIVIMKLFIFMIAIIGYFTISCKPDYLDIPIVTKTIGSNIRIEYMYFKTNDTMLVCGGIKNEKGEIYKSTDGGIHWSQVFACSDKINALYFFKNQKEGLAVGDSTRVQKTFDGGSSWTKKELGSDKMRIWRNDQSSLTRVCSWDNIGSIAICNENHESGNCFFSWDVGESWSDIQGSNGLRDWWIFHDDSIYAVGYGIIEKIEYQHQQGYLGYKPIVTPMSFDGDYFTGIWFTSDNVGYLSGFDGGIYKTTDAGKSWKTVFKKNKLFQERIHFNDILFVSDKVGYVVGEDGLFMKTVDEGNTWNHIKMPTSNALLGLFYNNGTVYICSEQGTYYEIKN